MAAMEPADLLMHTLSRPIHRNRRANATGTCHVGCKQGREREGEAGRHLSGSGGCYFKLILHPGLHPSTPSLNPPPPLWILVLSAMFSLLTSETERRGRGQWGGWKGRIDSVERLCTGGLRPSLGSLPVYIHQHVSKRPGAGARQDPSRHVSGSCLGTPSLPPPSLP